MTDAVDTQPTGSADFKAVDREQWLHIYDQMFKIRTFERHVNELYITGKMPGLAHLYSGQEAVAVGVCEALRREDYITSTHRGHGHCLAKGAAMDRMFAELLGKASGYCRGKGGSMHIADQEKGNLGANAIVGGSAGIATGAAMSAKMRRTDQVSVCFFGEGALGQGLFYEVMNMAALWQLPVIYVCENNLYNEYTHFSETTAGQLLDRARAFDIHAEEIDGQDVRVVYATTRRLVDRVRQGQGPGYYRSKEEEIDWRTRRDPLKLLGDWMVDQGMADAPLLERIENQGQSEAEAAVQFALDAPYPDVSEVDRHVYA
jgi:pyruvate dehydrogenase E1 component alpha subunit